MKASILIPARNEEKVLPRLLNSLENLNFDKNNFEILFGNDGSTDATAAILNDFAQKHSNVKIVDINQNHPLIGKTRALNELAKLAQGQYLFFTDADISLPKEWINGMLKEFSRDKNIGVVIGLTILKPDNFWHAMQSMEWLIALSNIKSLDERNIPTTGMGNNMAVTAEAYHAVGGYENIPFSIVEDYALYIAIIQKGYGFYQAFNADVLAYTLAPKDYFEQRKRWVSGAIQCKSKLIWVGVVRAFLFPIMLVLLFFYPVGTLVLIIFELLLNIFLTRKFEKATKVKGYIKWVPAFTIFGPFILFLQFLYYLLPGKVVWKGRNYSK